jgi:hypothetical protein
MGDNTDQGLGSITPQTGPRAGQKIYKQPTGGVAKTSTPSGYKTPAEIADTIEDQDTNMPSAGRGAQSTDASNQY